jgi:Tfp pilus assembly protein PilF
MNNGVRDADDKHDAAFRARSLADLGVMSAAKELLQATVAKDPGDVSAIRELANVYMAEGDALSAAPLRLQAVELEPRNVELIIETLASCRVCGEEFDEVCRRLVRRGLELDPDNVDLLRDLASSYRIPDSGVSIEEASELYRRAVQLAPTKWDLLLNYASFLHVELGRNDEALKLAKRSLTNMPPVEPTAIRATAEDLVARLEKEVS